MSKNKFVQDLVLADAQDPQDPTAVRDSHVLTGRELVAKRSKLKADEIAAVRGRLSRSSVGMIERAATLDAEHHHGPLSDDDWKMFQRAATAVAQRSAIDDQLAKLEKRARKLSVVAEPRVYGPESPHSFFLDAATVSSRVFGAQPSTDAAVARQARYGQELEYHRRRGDSEGRRADRILRERYRDIDVNASRRNVESRAIGSGGGTSVEASAEMAAFVSPAVLEQLWVSYLDRSPLVNVCQTPPAPEYGVNVYLPQVTAAPGALSQTEGDSVTETDPTVDFRSAELQTVVSYVTVSQQLADRSGGNTVGGGTFDALLGKQMALELARQSDTIALTAVLDVANVVAFNGTFALVSDTGVGGLVGALGQCASNVRGTAGAYLEPDHVFFTPARWSWLQGWADAQGRPIVLPSAVVSNPARKYGDTGLDWGGLAVAIDPYIPNLGTTSDDQIIVLDSTEVYVFRSQVVTETIVMPQQTLSIEVAVRSYQYCAAIVRYESGVQVVAGTALSTPAF